MRIRVDCAHALAQADWWAETLKWEREPTDQGILQSVLDQTVKDRIHLDVRLDDMDKEEARTALEQRGATFLYEASQGPQSWYTMADPEGNEFCIN
ncbi:VOC family protein [Arthrobacter sp. zg-Y769]|uniref:VOC family protein n=1 Tax=Arthrobacter sp. zg-Y769 TaxID=2894191 RepID=UPI002F3E253D|nr:hypothetical protein [Arthrobacter sp. zg-Y769]